MILCGYFGDTTRNGRGGENEREEPGAEADTSWKFEDLWQSPTGDVSHASNFGSACTAYPPSAESTTAQSARWVNDKAGPTSRGAACGPALAFAKTEAEVIHGVPCGAL